MPWSHIPQLPTKRGLRPSSVSRELTALDPKGGGGGSHEGRGLA